jgi:hypothetical protein
MAEAHKDCFIVPIHWQCGKTAGWCLLRTAEWDMTVIAVDLSPRRFPTWRRYVARLHVSGQLTEFPIL